MKLICATGNFGKFATGRDTLEQYGIELIQNPIDVDEIQGSDYEKIAIDKAKKAYEIIQQPLVVTDDCWDICALNGFPGAYMKEVNGWFSVDDFLTLLKDKNDRSVVLIQNLAYIDRKVIKTFTYEAKGEFILTPKGLDSAPPWAKIMVMNGYAGKTIAEVYADEANGTKDSEHDKDTAQAWHKLGNWLVEEYLEM